MSNLSSIYHSLVIGNQYIRLESTLRHYSMLIPIRFAGLLLAVLTDFSCVMPLALAQADIAESSPPLAITPDARIPESDMPVGSPELLPTQPMDQLTSVDQLADVQSSDWAFRALESLVEQYGCTVGFPSGVYQGSRALTRFEFATGLNACLNQLEQQLAAAIAPLATEAELRAIQRLQAEFAPELAQLTRQVGLLEDRVQALSGFSTTTQLRGESIFALQDLWGSDTGATNNLVFQSRNALVFDTSFTGEDRLRAAVQAGNFQQFELPDDSSEARVGFDTDTEQDFKLDELSYELPIGERINLVAIGQGGNFGSLIESINPLSSSGQGALSRFARRNPVLRGAGFEDGFGFGASFDLFEDVLLNVGYISAESNSPAPGSGLLNGGYGVAGQVVITPGDFALSLVYAHSYVSDDGNDTGTGSRLANVAVEYPASENASEEDSENTRPVVINAYGLELNYRVADWLEVGGWAGLSAVRVIEQGDAEVWNYALRLAFPDLGGEGNLGGLIVGMQPRLTGTTTGLGRELGQRQDADLGLHVEGFYRIWLADYLSLTPGLIWLTAPNHDQDNPDVVVGVIRTTFSF